MNSKLHEQMYMYQHRGVAGGPAATRRDSFYNLLHMMRTFFAGLAREPEWQNHKIVVFVDTNPAFTEYTQLALCEWWLPWDVCCCACQQGSLCLADSSLSLAAPRCPPLQAPLTS